MDFDPRFVGGLLEPMSLVTRRSLLKGSSIAALAAGLHGCVRRPEDIIYPYSKAPEDLIPGIASHFATVTARGRDALGVLVTSHDGRPTKVEGNSLFPTSQGATDVRAQEYVWDLYDPDRSRSPARRQGNALVNATEEELDSFLKSLIDKHAKDQGTGLRILTPISNSPTFRAMREKVLAMQRLGWVYKLTATARGTECGGDFLSNQSRFTHAEHNDIAMTVGDLVYNVQESRI